MRLIDADKLIKSFNFLYKNGAPINLNAKQVLIKVMEQRTAYDIDKVVEKLEIERFKSNYEQEQVIYDKAIEIVKQELKE